MSLLQQLPVLVVLERLPVPVLAIADDGMILFANEAFAEMLGHPPEQIRLLQFSQIFREVPNREPATSVLRAYADLIVDLVHRDGSIVRARMSRSALLRGDDPVVLAAFQDLTEQLWAAEE